jgi:hypothetical protein
MNKLIRYRIKNWDKYQHYKTRNPPWIKLHCEIITSEDWVMLDDQSRVLAIACMLMASKDDDGHIPDNPSYIQRVCYLHNKPDFTPLLESGFLQVVDIIEPRASKKSNPLARNAKCLQTQKDARPETETETEGEAKTETETKHPSPAGLEGFEEFWKAYPRKVGIEAARKAWKKLKPSKATRVAIMGALSVQRMCHDWTKENGQFIPHPTTWLNQGRWEDEINVQHNNGIDTQSRSHATPELIAMQARIEAEHRAEEEARRKAMA